MTSTPTKTLLGALKQALAHIDATPHGDNCFLHDDGGEFDRCFCGKDSIVAYLDEVIEQGEPCGNALTCTNLSEGSAV